MPGRELFPGSAPVTCPQLPGQRGCSRHHRPRLNGTFVLPRPRRAEKCAQRGGCRRAGRAPPSGFSHRPRAAAAPLQSPARGPGDPTPAPRRRQSRAGTSAAQVPPRPGPGPRRVSLRAGGRGRAARADPPSVRGPGLPWEVGGHGGGRRAHSGIA